MKNMKVIDQYLVASRMICSDRGASIKELSQALHISERAVFELLTRFDAILPIDTVPDEENRRCLRYVAHGKCKPDIDLPPMELSDAEKAYFEYMTEAVDSGLLGDSFSRFINKLRFMLAERGAYLESEDLGYPPLVLHHSSRINANTRHTDKTIKVLTSCIVSKQWVKLITVVNECENRLLVYPLVIVDSDEGSFLYALSPEEKLLCLNLEAIKAISQGISDDEPKTKPDIETIVSDPFGADWDTEPMSVELVLCGKAAEAEPSKIWPDSVSFEEKDDGTVHMTAKTHSRRGCIRWILGRTPDVKVISPHNLKDELLAIYKKALS